MKKSMRLLSVIFALCVQTVNAQTFGIKGGVNIANLSFSSGGMGVSPKSLTGLHIGPVADFELKEKLHFNTGLLYSLKGASPTMLADIKIDYIDVPLNLAYLFPINKKSDFFIQAGPYLGYGMYANAGTLDLFSIDGGLKRFDYGLGFGTGVQFGSIVTSVNYELGLANLDWSNSEETKNKVFQISLAYMFGKKK
jgi:hypothetical protein